MTHKQKLIPWFFAIWLFSQKVFFISYPLAMIGTPDEITRIIKPLLNVVLIILMVFLIQMKDRARFFAAACFSIALFALGILSKTIVTSQPIKYSAIIYVAVSIIGNIVSIWILLSPSYEQLCAKLRIEKLIAKEKKKGTYINVDDLER